MEANMCENLELCFDIEMMKVVETQPQGRTG